MKKVFEKLFGRMTITILLILLQILWFVGFLIKLGELYLVLSSVVRVFAVLIVISVANKEDNPAYKLAWTTIILLFPILGVALYMLFGRHNVNARARKRFAVNDVRFQKHLPLCEAVINEIKEHDRQVANISRYIKNVAGYPVYHNEGLTFHPLGDDGLSELKEELKRAKEFIFMEYFIIEPGGKVFEEIVEILKEKAASGVDVRLIYDDVGCVMYCHLKDYIRLKSYGIKVRAFNPISPFLAAFYNNRDHRKITVIDGKIAFTGGYNLADEYANIKTRFGKWKDTGIKCSGPVVDSFTAMFLSMWNSIGKENEDYARFFNRCEPASDKMNGYIQAYADTPLDSERVGEDVYLNIIKTACDYVYIYTPYLIIDNEMMRELCLAAKSGVDVRIVTPGIPDKKLVYLLTQSYYEQLLKAGVRVYQYTPGFIHAKTYICDDNIATVGTINMDYRSLFLHFECGTFMYKCDEISKIRVDFEKTFGVSCEVTLENIKKRNVFVKSFQSILRLFAPLI